MEEATLYKMVCDGKNDYLLYQKKFRFLGLTLFKRFVHVPKFVEAYDEFGVPFRDASKLVSRVNSMNTALNLFIIQNICVSGYLRTYRNSVNAHEERKSAALTVHRNKRSHVKYYRNGVEVKS